MLRVLIAEEKDFVAARLTAQLRGLGHRVLGVVRDGHAAVACARRLQPDLILLDQHLPPLDGVGAAREILAQQVVPLVLLIGYPAAGLVRRAQEAGVLAYLVWPADANALRSAIGVARARFRELQALCRQAGDLPQVLRARLVVERAKKALMRRLELGPADAFDYLERQSQGTARPIAEVAEGVLAVDDLWFGKSDLAGCVALILHALAPGGVAESIRTG